MHTIVRIVIFVSIIVGQMLLLAHSQEVQNQLSELKLNRKKRFLKFPKGTVIQLVYCYLMSALGTDGIFTVGVTLGTNWDVPTDLDQLIYNEQTAVKVHRRDRRSLYPKIELILSKLGVNGRMCIKQQLCNSRKRYLSLKSDQIKTKYTFIEEIIYTFFLYPELPGNTFEPSDMYDDMTKDCDFNQNNYQNYCMIIK